MQSYFYEYYRYDDEDDENGNSESPQKHLEMTFCWKSIIVAKIGGGLLANGLVTFAVQCVVM